MLMKETLEILEKIMKETNITEIRIHENTTPLHTPEDIEKEEAPQEYDINIVETVWHWQIQIIDDLLGGYDNVEMMFDPDDGLVIYEREKVSCG